ncbi:MAG: ABC transporter ATP-binding protein [Firmicutes bacterium]|nr:ABC transporter ATP-binding protein [Candidatus Alectryobacillus merdavium]
MFKEKILKAENLVKTFKVGDSTLNAVDGVSFEIEKGDLVIIVGPSGAGKTTLLNLIGGMDKATSGSLIVDKKDVAKYNEKELTLYRRNDVGFVFQFYNLMPNLTALENVELATELKKDSLDPKTILESVGLGERLRNFPGQLSGGEQQRVSIARAIAKNPKIILCDEPTGALDYKTGKNILKLLSDVAKKKGKTVIIVTHNSALTEIGDKVFKIKNGKIEESIVNKTPKNIEEVEW